MLWTIALSELGGAAWGLPVAIGLLGAPFLATATSRSDLGAWVARKGIFAGDPFAAPASVASHRLRRAPVREGALRAA